MTPAQKKLKELRERQSRERQRMAELGLADSLTDETRAELDGIEAGTPDLERQLRAAQAAVEQEETEQKTETRETEPDAEMRERIELRGKASLAGFLMAAARGRLPSGAEAELQAAAWPDGVPAGAGAGAIPIELFDVPTPAERRERRDVTDAPGTVGVNLDPIRPMVFANAILPRLGVEMPRVMSGTYASATITGSQSAEAKEKSAAIAATAGAFTVTTATPKRISARLELTLEDIAAVGQANFEPILRDNLALALSDKLDEQGLTGDGMAPNLAGMFSRLTDPDPAPGTVANFDDFARAHADGIDGLWAATIRDVGIVVGPATMKLAARTFQTADSYKGELSAAAYAMDKTGGFWTNKRMPDGDNDNVQQAILYRSGASMMNGSGAMRKAVCPHWNVIDIDDIYSGSAKGERYFTMHVLLGDVILVQPDAYQQVAFKVA